MFRKLQKKKMLSFLASPTSTLVPPPPSAFLEIKFSAGRPLGFSLDRNGRVAHVRAGSQADKQGVQVGWNVVAVEEKKVPPTTPDRPNDTTSSALAFVDDAIDEALMRLLSLGAGLRDPRFAVTFGFPGRYNRAAASGAISPSPSPQRRRHRPSKFALRSGNRGRERIMICMSHAPPKCEEPPPPPPPPPPPEPEEEEDDDDDEWAKEQLLLTRKKWEGPRFLVSNKTFVSNGVGGNAAAEMFNRRGLQSAGGIIGSGQRSQRSMLMGQATEERGGGGGGDGGEGSGIDSAVALGPRAAGIPRAATAGNLQQRPGLPGSPVVQFSLGGSGAPDRVAGATSRPGSRGGRPGSRGGFGVRIHVAAEPHEVRSQSPLGRAGASIMSQ